MEWVSWALLEGIGLGVSRLFFSLGGGVSPSLAYILFAAACAGCLQAFVGGAVACAKRQRFRPSGTWHAFGPVALGVNGLIANTFAFAAFQAVARADMAASNFIATVPVVLLSTLFGKILFSEPLGWRQGVGLVFAIGGAYLVIPISFSALWRDGTPVWVWFSLGTALFATINEFVSKGMAQWESRQKKPKLSPWVLQFWGGLSMVGVAFSGFFVLAPADARAEIIDTDFLWLYGVAAGVASIAWWTCRLFAYQRDAPVSIRRFPTIGVSILTAAAIGSICFGEAFLPKLPGIVLFIPAFFFGQNKSERYLWDAWHRLQPYIPNIIRPTTAFHTALTDQAGT